MKALVPSEVETSRMRLKRMVPEHFDLLKPFWADPLVAEYTSLKPLDETQAWVTLAANVGHWAIRGYGVYCAFEKLSGEFIGTMGLWNPETWPEPEFTCSLRPKYWGGRYGVEGGRRFVDVVQREMGWSTLVSVIRKGNEKSVRGLLRLGAKFDHELPMADGDWQIYRLFETSNDHASTYDFHHGPGRQPTA